jgi:hypothetical protein
VESLSFLERSFGFGNNAELDGKNDIGCEVEFKLQAHGTEVVPMSIFETLGLVWIILTSTLATVGLFYLAYVGIKTILKKEADLPAEVKEMFRNTR